MALAGTRKDLQESYDMIYKYLIPFLQTWLILGALYSIFPDAPIALVSTFFGPTACQKQLSNNTLASH